MLSSIGIVYTLCFLAVLLFYKDTLIVKRSITLSVFQIILHLIELSLEYGNLRTEKMDLPYTQYLRGVFAKVYYVDIYCKNKSIAQNIEIKCQDEKKYWFSIERSFFSHSL